MRREQTLIEGTRGAPKNTKLHNGKGATPWGRILRRAAHTGGELQKENEASQRVESSMQCIDGGIMMGTRV